LSKSIIISGGGTGGHIFPALAIAEELRRRDGDIALLFVGAKGGMEERVIPQKGYPYQSVWISGIQRQRNFKNLRRNASFPLKLAVSLSQAYRIVSATKPDCVVGVGGFASGPIGRVAAFKDIPLLLCEQNAYPGLVNRWLAPKAQKILLGNEAAKKYFPSQKVVVTGNPIRKMEIIARDEAAQILGFDPSKPIVLSVGGSLGARSINEAWLKHIHRLVEAEIQLLWQCGKRYHEALQPQIPTHPGIKLMPFIDQMNIAYSAADLVVSRAGGSTISELIALSKPAILIPSPNVAEDHQTQNALSLSERQAAVLIKDREIDMRLGDEIITLFTDTQKLQQLNQQLLAIEKHDSAKQIVEEILATLS